jgi:glycerol kinase
LYNIHTNEWDDELLAMLSIPKDCLPTVVDNAGLVGHTRDVGFLPDGIPVSGFAGDQQSALFGQACFGKGEAKSTYGTGAFVLMNTGAEAMVSANGLLTTIAWRLNGRTVYALEGSAFVAGAAVQWLRDQLGIISTAAEVEELAKTVEDNGGVSVVPAFTGLGAPHWNPDARASISGLTRGSTKGHIARATLEGVAMQVYDILEAMSQDAQTPLQVLKLDGGMARNNLMMQFQADVLGVDCLRSAVLETTALGAAFLAGLGIGFWESQQAIVDAWRVNGHFVPSQSDEEVVTHVTRWQTALGKI